MNQQMVVPPAHRLVTLQTVEPTIWNAFESTSLTSSDSQERQTPRNRFIEIELVISHDRLFNLLTGKNNRSSRKHRELPIMKD